MSYISKIQKRLSALVNDIGLERAKNFAVSHGASELEMTDAYHLALWVEGAPKTVKKAFLDLWEDCCNPRHLEDTGLRICDSCGKFMTEGYILGDGLTYACSRDCAVKSLMDEMWDADSPGYKVSREQAEKALDYNLEFSSDDFFWTEWYQG